MSTFTSLREASAYAGVSYITIREWARNYHIGTLTDGRWRVNKERLDELLIARAQLRETIDELRRSA